MKIGLKERLRRRWHAAVDDDVTVAHRLLVAAADARHDDHLCGCDVGAQVCLFGQVCAVALPGTSTLPFSVDVDDGTGVVRLLFPGVRRVEGLDLGAAVEVSGVLVRDGTGHVAIVEPDYRVGDGPLHHIDHHEETTMSKKPVPVTNPTPDQGRQRPIAYRRRDPDHTRRRLAQAAAAGPQVSTETRAKVKKDAIDDSVGY